MSVCSSYSKVPGKAARPAAVAGGGVEQGKRHIYMQAFPVTYAYCSGRAFPMHCSEQHARRVFVMGRCLKALTSVTRQGEVW